LSAADTGRIGAIMADGPLFIVDNGKSGRNGLDYLREWSELAKAVDIATRIGGWVPVGTSRRSARNFFTIARWRVACSMSSRSPGAVSAGQSRSSSARIVKRSSYDRPPDDGLPSSGPSSGTAQDVWSRRAILAWARLRADAVLRAAEASTFASRTAATASRPAAAR
jgi:hypothetical protein